MEDGRPRSSKPSRFPPKRRVRLERRRPSPSHTAFFCTPLTLILWVGLRPSTTQDESADLRDTSGCLGLFALGRARLQPCRPELIMTRALAAEGFRGPVTNSSRQDTTLGRIGFHCGQADVSCVGFPAAGEENLLQQLPVVLGIAFRELWVSAFA
jgi:hypothetical protein